MESDVLFAENEHIMGSELIEIKDVYVMATQTTDVKNPNIVRNFYDLFIWDGKSKYGRCVAQNKKYEVIAGTAMLCNTTTGKVEMHPLTKYHPLFLRELIQTHTTMFYGSQQMFDGVDPFQNMRECFEINAKLLGSAMRVKYEELVQMQTYLWRIQKQSYKKYSKLRVKQQRKEQKTKLIKILNEIHNKS